VSGRTTYKTQANKCYDFQAGLDQLRGSACTFETGQQLTTLNNDHQANASSVRSTNTFLAEKFVRSFGNANGCFRKVSTKTKFFRSLNFFLVKEASKT
jgi:hypothetical protein